MTLNNGNIVITQSGGMAPAFSQIRVLDGMGNLTTNSTSLSGYDSIGLADGFELESGDILITGFLGNGPARAWMWRFDPYFNLKWSKVLASSNSGLTFIISSVRQNNRIYSCGSSDMGGVTFALGETNETNLSSQGFISVHDEDGTFIAAIGTERCNDMHIDHQNNILILTNSFVGKFDPATLKLEKRLFTGGTGYLKIASDASGYLYVVGTMFSPVLGSAELNSKSYTGNVMVLFRLHPF